jgi:hypothetical protein
MSMMELVASIDMNPKIPHKSWTREQVNSIKRLVDAQFSQAEIAEIYGSSNHAIRAVKARR